MNSCVLDPENDFLTLDCQALDTCPYDADNDADTDQICGNVDSCAEDVENDVDGDDICGNLDSCAQDTDNDIDNDDICGDVDSAALDLAVAFFQGHLSWTDTFLTEVIAADADGFYSRLAAITQSFLMQESSEYSTVTQSAGRADP